MSLMCVRGQKRDGIDHAYSEGSHIGTFILVWARLESTTEVVLVATHEEKPQPADATVISRRVAVTANQSDFLAIYRSRVSVNTYFRL